MAGDQERLAARIPTPTQPALRPILDPTAEPLEIQQAYNKLINQPALEDD